MQLVFSFLGTFQVTLNGKPLRFATDSARALLAYLVVEAFPAGHLHSRLFLAHLLWPEQPEATARHNLRQALLHLRQGLGEAASPLLQSTTQNLGISTEVPLSCDVHRFQQLLDGCTSHPRAGLDQCTSCLNHFDQAVALYPGEFLHGLSFTGSYPFEDWVLIRREQMHWQVIHALHALTESSARIGDYTRMQHYAERQLAREPWHEEAHRQLMTALAARGERSAALAQYKICRRILAKELDTTPSAETEALYIEIKQGNLRSLNEARRS
jgi:DNA-binding SARP family transcriptional activator